MTLLALETATEVASAALLDGEELRAAFSYRARRDVCQRLLLDVRALMERTGVAAESLSAVAVGRGPGSFTGIRIGVALAKGLALARDIPVFGISTLAACAYPAREMGGIVCALLPAHGGEVYAGIFRGDGQLTPLQERVFRADELTAHLSQLGQPVTLATPARQVRELLPLQQLAVEHRFAAEEASWHLACWVGRLAQARLAAGDRGDGIGLAPVYLRPSQAEMQAPAR